MKTKVKGRFNYFSISENFVQPVCLPLPRVAVVDVKPLFCVQLHNLNLISYTVVGAAMPLQVVVLQNMI